MNSHDYYSFCSDGDAERKQLVIDMATPVGTYAQGCFVDDRPSGPLLYSR